MCGFSMLFLPSTHTQVGKNISTKAVGTKRREDITEAYKYKEGTMANRAALGAKEKAKVHGRGKENRGWGGGREGRGGGGGRKGRVMRRRAE